MRKLGPRQREKVIALVEGCLDRLIRFRLSYDSTIYLLRRAKANWREIDLEITERRIVKAVGVVAKRYEMQDNSSPSRFLVEEQADSETVLQSLDFPIEAAAINYIFTLVEMYGDAIVSVVNRKFFIGKYAPKNWHSRIHGDADIDDAEKLIRMRRALAEPFRLDVSDVPMFTVAMTIELKRVRNDFAHTASTDSTFEVLFSYAVDLVCQIYFWTIDDEEILIEYPFTEFSSRFRDARDDVHVINEMKAKGEW